MPSLKWTGMVELMQALRAVPDACMGEAVHLMEAELNSAAVDIKTAYPSVTGNLRKRVTVTRPRIGGHGEIIDAEIRSAAPHAHLYEFGTETRQYPTATKMHNTGSAPPHPVFLPRVELAGKRLKAEFNALPLRHGATSVRMSA